MENIKKFLFSNSNTRQTVIKNTFWLFLGEISGRVLKMFLVVYAARNLGAEGWGIFSYALSIGSLLMLFTDVGIDNLITREISQKRENYRMLTSAALTLKSIILIISTMLVIFVGPVISNIQAATNLLSVIAVILLFDAVRSNFFAINRVSEKMEKETMIKIAMNAVIFGLGYFFIRANPEPMSLAISYAIGGIVGTFLILGIVRKTVTEFMIMFDRKAIKSALSTILPFTVIALLGSILANTDILMLGLWKNAGDIGTYTAVQRFYQFIAVIPAMIATATLPLMSKLANQDNAKLKTVVEKILTVFMMVIMPIMLGGIILAKEIILLTFGAGYMQAIPILQIILTMSLAAFPSILFSNTVFVYDKQKELVFISIIGVLINIVLNFLLIPKFGATGAAFATLASTWIMAFITWRKIKKINNFEIWPSIKTALFPTLIMIVVTLWLKYLDIGVMANIIISAIIYFVAFLLLKRKTLAELKEIFGIQ